MKRLLFLSLAVALIVSCVGRNNQQNQQPKSYWDTMDEGWTKLGSIPTYSLESDGMMHCCTDCARLDYQIINGVTRYRIFYPLHSTYYNVVRNPEYRTISRYGNYAYKAGPFYLNL